ncbi:hypothetical protein [Mesorhizobium sp.]|uniref:NACHT domain-containing protein n=1 Tax=Mesorhizobium sp. TaxID=1871066 RepID=UPI000FE5BC71|nr:hypothetical protein [Mesorhizobium sp.]RWQ20553.1 MAG: hypothetical protein EOS19_32075 [Mesorhizobium sp.]
MPTPTFELTRLDGNTFEHLANMLALKVLGSGHTGFGPGPDAGRDGYFEGTADYPSQVENWSGTWYLQSKFHAPHLSTDPQKWLVDQIKTEIKLFSDNNTTRQWPDNWIVITNIDPSGAAQTGSFDRALEAVKKVRPSLAKHFHIWGGRKVLDLLALNPEIADYYAEFITPGAVISEMYKSLLDAKAKTEDVVRYLVVTQLTDQQYTKLEQAGSSADNRPSIQKLFTDLPFVFEQRRRGLAVRTLAKALAQKQIVDGRMPNVKEWKDWQREPARARIWFVKGGPGQGKSTLTQYICQIQRAAFLLSSPAFSVTPAQRSLADDIRKTASRDGLWPIAPRIPVNIELKTFARWVGEQTSGSQRMLAYLTHYLSNELAQHLAPGTLKRAFGHGKWLFVFDGLDEVPGDVKDRVASEVIHFVDDLLVACNADASIVCTSRPQGYSGQFDVFEAATIELTSLSKEQALSCASPLLRLERSTVEGDIAIRTLKDALASAAIAEIMTTPLQAHIMAVIVRDGGKPPDRKWQLFNTFYNVIKKREANRNLLDPLLSKILREGDRLIKTLHNRLGFELHSRAETSGGATTSLAKDEFRSIVEEVVSSLQDRDVDATVAALMLAATDRLVLVSTPESGEYVRFDIRPLQEFFAAEQIYESAEPSSLIERVRIVAGDSHWREVMHFLLSALVENHRKAELVSITTVLTELDDGYESDTRALSRKLARGGIISARLLSEGVLEQDKRIRALFAKCFSGLMSSPDAGIFLSTVRSDHSLNWLFDTLLITMREQSESEAIGAAITLASLLPDGDGRAGPANELIHKASNDFITQLLEVVAGSETRTDSPLPKWTVGLALTLLLEDHWYRRGERSITACLRILEMAESALPEIAKTFGISRKVSERLGAILVISDRRTTRQVGRTIKYNAIEIERITWAKELDWENWTKDFWNSLENSPGIIKSIFYLFRFLKSRADGDARALFNDIDGAKNIMALPPTVRMFIDCDQASEVERNDFSNSERLILTPENREDKIIYFAHAAHHRAQNARGSRRPDVDWEPFILNEPTYALHLIGTGEDDSEKLRALARRPDIITKLVSGIRNQWVFRWMLLDIGSFTENYPDLSKALVEAMIIRSSGPVIYGTFGFTINPFRMNLPKDAALLPHIVASCLDSMGHQQITFRREHLPQRQQASQWAGKYAPRIDDLIQVHTDGGQPKRVRTAARLLMCLHPDFEGSLPPLDEIVSMYDVAESHWYLRGISLVLTDSIKRSDLAAWKAMSKLLEIARSDYQGRGALTTFIRDWRELALAPVTQSNNPQLWI